MAGQNWGGRYPRVYAASASRTANLTGDTVNVRNARGVLFEVDITVDGTFSQTFTVQGINPISGTAYTLLSSAAKTAVGLFTLAVGMDIPTTANVSIGTYLPQRIRLVTSGTITAATYSIHMTLID
jgi:hypothetical protein